MTQDNTASQKLEALAAQLVSDSQLLQGQLTHLTQNLNTFQQLLTVQPQRTDSERVAKNTPETLPEDPLIAQSRESQSGKRRAYAKKDLVAVRHRGEKTEKKNKTKQSNEQWEIVLGVRWLSRLGMLAVLIGIAIAFAYAFPSFTASMKLLVGALLSGAMFFGGHQLQNGNSTRTSSTLAMVLKGGSLAVGYLTLFAMFFIPEVQLFHSLPVGITALMVYNGLMLLYAHKARSQTIAVLALIFGYYTASYSGTEDVALITSTVLSVTAVILSALNPSWRTMIRLSCLQAMITVWYWEFTRLSYVQSSLLLNPYLWTNFLLFQFAGCTAMKGGDKALTALSVFGYYGLFYVIHNANANLGGTGALELIIGGIQLVYLILIAKLESLRETKENLSTLLQALCVTFVALATMSHFEGNQILPAVTAAEAMALGVLSLKETRKGVYYIGAQLLWLASLLIVLPWGGFHSSDAATVLSNLMSPLWVAFVGFLLDHYVLRAKSARYRGLFSILASGAFFLAVNVYVPSSWVTATVALGGFLLLTLGFKLQIPLYRRLGLLWFAMSGLHLVFNDLVGLEVPQKILAFVGLGLAMLGASYGYSKLIVQTQLNRMPEFSDEAATQGNSGANTHSLE